MVERKKMGRHVEQWGRGEAYTGFSWENLKERGRELGKPRRRWEDNIKMDWIKLAQDRDR
jgi:hypothetical protein